MNEMDAELATWVGRIKSVNPGGHRENCAECAVLTDKMLEGLEFRASAEGQMTSLRILERLFGAEFKPRLSRLKIEAVLKVAGPGARAIIHGYPEKPVVS